MTKARATVKKDVAKAKTSARKASASVKKDVSQAKRTAGKVQTKVREQVRKVQAQARSQARKVEKKVAEAAAPVLAVAQSITPSPLSRAFLATSQGKKEAAELGLAPGEVPAETPATGDQDTPPQT